MSGGDSILKAASDGPEAWERFVDSLPDPYPKAIDVVLDEAADLFQTGAQGWMQGNPGYNIGRTEACMMQAVVIAGGAEYESRKSATLAVQYVSQQLDVPGHVWNDEPGRTKDEVIEMLRGLAKEYRENTQVES